MGKWRRGGGMCSVLLGFPETSLVSVSRLVRGKVSYPHQPSSRGRSHGVNYPSLSFFYDVGLQLSFLRDERMLHCDESYKTSKDKSLRNDIWNETLWGSVSISTRE